MHDPVLQVSLSGQQLIVGTQLAGLELVDALLDGAVLSLDLLLDLCAEGREEQSCRDKKLDEEMKRVQ